MKKVLFVCTGNTCRSPMAQMIFNSLAEKEAVDALSFSAGLYTVDGLPMNPKSEKVLEEIGINSEPFSSTDIHTLELDKFDVIFGMTEEHLKELAQLGVSGEKLSLLGENGSGVKDPYGLSLDAYRKCRDEIFNSLKEVIKGMKNDSENS